MSIINLSEEEWGVLKESYKQRLNTIVIPMDVSPGIAKGLLSRIDNFFSLIRLELAEVHGEKEVIDGIIREWERSKAIGTNDMVRKLNATKALQEYPNGASTINLYEVQRRLAIRHSFLEGIKDILDAKQGRLITINGLLKLDSQLSPHADIR